MNLKITDPCRSMQLQCESFFQGIIDPVKEQKKLAERKDKAEQSVLKLTEAMAHPDYVAKVPEEVRSANDEKVSHVISNHVISH